MRDLPKAYGGCSCPCHKQPGVMHVVACCYPIDDVLRKIYEEKKANEEAGKTTGSIQKNEKTIS